MWTAITLIVVVAAAIAVVLWLRRNRRTAPSSQAAPRPQDPFAPGNDTYGDPRALKAGDMVELLGQRLFVRGSLRLREGGYQWSEHFLDEVTGEGDGTRRWLSVEEDPDLEVVSWHELTGAEAEGLQPSARSLTHDGVEYRREEHGTATFTSEGTTGLGSTGQAEYADFAGPRGKYLAFERFDQGQWEVSIGERVPSGTLTIFPGTTPGTDPDAAGN